MLEQNLLQEKFVLIHFLHKNGQAVWTWLSRGGLNQRPSQAVPILIKIRKPPIREAFGQYYCTNFVKLLRFEVIVSK